MLPKLKWGTRSAQAPPASGGKAGAQRMETVPQPRPTLQSHSSRGEKAVHFKREHLKLVTVNPPPVPPPRAQMLWLSFLVCNLTKQTKTGGSISEAQQCKDHYSHPTLIFPTFVFFFLLIKVKLFWFPNRRKAEKLNQSRSSPHNSFSSKSKPFFSIKKKKNWWKITTTFQWSGFIACLNLKETPTQRLHCLSSCSIPRSPPLQSSWLAVPVFIACVPRREISEVLLISSPNALLIKRGNTTCLTHNRFVAVSNKDQGILQALLQEGWSGVPQGLPAAGGAHGQTAARGNGLLRMKLSSIQGEGLRKRWCSSPGWG